MKRKNAAASTTMQSRGTSTHEGLDRFHKHLSGCGCVPIFASPTSLLLLRAIPCRELLQKLSCSGEVWRGRSPVFSVHR